MADAQKYTSKLISKRVLVIGGTSGIGFAAAEAAIEYGADVTITSSRQTRVDAAISKFQDSYPSAKSRIHGFAVNLGNDDIEEQVVKIYETATNGKKDLLDHVILTAADKLNPTPLKDVTLEYVRKAGHMRLLGPIFVAKHAATYVKPTHESSLTLTSGTIAEHPIPNWDVIAAYATGGIGLMRNLALELRPIRVNIVEPGAVDTELWENMPKEAYEGFKASMAKASTTGRIGGPQDVAEAYLYAMRDYNCSGVVLRTDGGNLVM